MSVDTKFGRYCDCCGRSIGNAVRIHLNKEYCRACYQTSFVRVDCTKCKQQMRRHRHAEGEAVCGACRRSSRTCIRCGKFTPRAGKLVGSGAACNACAPYFREQRPCTSCGRLSGRLSRPLFAGLPNEICDGCRRGLNQATCSVCRRHRTVAGRTASDAPLCKDCSPGQSLTHACPGCGVTIPGSGLGRCRACTNRVAVGRQAHLVAAELEALWARELWNAFVAHQLQDDSGDPKLRQRIDHSADFFRELARHFAKVEDIDAETFATRMDSRLQRKHLVASRFVIDALALGPTREHRDAVTEQRRIGDLLDGTAGKPWSDLLNRYAVWLRSLDVSVRTQRLYLRAAEAFCRHIATDGLSPWREDEAVGYLCALPGHAASLGRFITYCRNHLEWDVRLPPKALWLRNERKKTLMQVKRLRKALDNTRNQPEQTLKTREVARVLSLALCVPAVQLDRERANGRVHVHDDGGIEVTTDAVIEPADPLYRYARRWMQIGTG